MQYTFYINQKLLYELGLDKQLDVIDLLLFDAIYKWFNNENMLCIANGTTYIEIRHNLVTKECPILGINHRDTFRKRMLKLVSAGLLERYQNNQIENTSLYKRGKFFNCFDSGQGLQIEIGNLPTQIVRGADSNRQGVQIEIGTNNIQYNKDNKETKSIDLVKKNSQKPSLEERQKSFADRLVPFVEYYGKEMIRAFYDYWSEPTLDGKKMRLELQKTFEISRRLSYWYRRGNNQ